MRDILRAFVKAGIGSGLNLVLGLARNKLLAVALGPQGMGVLALLQQLQATALPIATLGGDAPLVQGLASRKDRARDEFLASAALSLLTGWGICLIAFLGILPFLGTNFFSGELFLNSFTVRLMSLPVLFSAMAAFFLSLLTAVGAVGTLQKSQLIGSVFGVLAALPLLFVWESRQSHLLVLYLTAAPIFSLTAAIIFSTRLNSTRELLSNFRLAKANSKEVKSYLFFGGTTLVTGFIVTATWLIIRFQIARKLGTESLGHFSAVVSLSGLSLNLMGTALASFYLPKFAAASEQERPIILRQVLKLLTPVAVFIFLILVTFPELILKTLYSKEFVPASSLLTWWAAGDLMRTISFVFGHTIFAGRHLKFAFYSEIIFSALLLIGIYTGLKLQVNIGVAYFIIYSVYLLIVYQFCRRFGYV